MERRKNEKLFHKRLRLQRTRGLSAGRSSPGTEVLEQMECFYAGKASGGVGTSMLVGTLAIVQGLGDPPRLSRARPPFPHTTGPEAKAGSSQSQSLPPKQSQHPPSGPALQLHRLLRGHLHFFSLQKAKQSIYCSLPSDHKTNTNSLVRWKR